MCIRILMDLLLCIVYICSVVVKELSSHKWNVFLNQRLIIRVV
jgi:hypothetical protein